MKKKIPNKRILIIEDERAMARALELKFQNAGFSVQTVFDSSEAMVQLEKTPFDLILLDLIMPESTGFKIIETIKRLKLKNDNIPIIVLSNLGQEEDKRKAKELGAVEYFVKYETPILKVIKKAEEILK